MELKRGRFSGRFAGKLMVHHLSFPVTDLERSAAFYDAALSPLGYSRLWADDSTVGYSSEGDSGIFVIRRQTQITGTPGEGFHVAFAAPSREAVISFYDAALRLGGTDNGRPELCPEYSEHYFAGFVIDPDGFRIEAVINKPV